MRVLIVNDHVVCGGAEVQSLREKKILEERGIEVFFLYFDQESDITKTFKDEDGFIRIHIQYGLIRRSLCKLGLFSRFFLKRRQLIKVLKDINPDYIHINVLTKEPLAIYSLLSKYPTVQTLRDYTCVCPKLDCVKRDGLCKGSFYSDCYQECYKTYNDKLAIRLYKRVVECRKQSVDRFITPSKRLLEYALSNGYKNVICINNPIDTELFRRSYVEKSEQIFEVKNYLWTGVINVFRYSGLKMLVDVFDKFQVGKAVTLTIAGKVDLSLAEEFYNLIDDKDYIKYLGAVDNKKLLGIVSSSYVAVNPSLIMDNYPNTVLEALALGTLVIGSSMGGIPEMLDDNRGLIFDNTAEGLARCLNHSYSLSIEDYLKITKKAREYTLQNNSVNTYCSKILSIFDIKPNVNDRHTSFL